MPIDAKSQRREVRGTVTAAWQSTDETRVHRTRLGHASRYRGTLQPYASVAITTMCTGQLSGLGRGPDAREDHGRGRGRTDGRPAHSTPPRHPARAQPPSPRTPSPRTPTPETRAIGSRRAAAAAAASIRGAQGGNGAGRGAGGAHKLAGATARTRASKQARTRASRNPFWPSRARPSRGRHPGRRPCAGTARLRPGGP